MSDYQVVGRVSVKVMPDVKGFRGELEKEVKKATAGLAANIGVDLDDSIRDDLKRMVEQAERESGKIKLSIDEGSASSLKSALRKVEQEISKQRAIEVDIDVSPEALEHARREIQNKLEQADPTVAIGLEELSLKAAQARLALLARTRIVNLVPVVSKGAAASAATALAALSGARIVDSWMHSFWDNIKNLDKAIPKLAAIGLGITAIGAAGLQGSANLFALSSSLAQIGPLALTLPGLFAGMAIGLGATVAVLKDFNKMLPDVGDRLSALQDAMSERFWEKALPGFREMVDTLLPQFEDGLKSTSTQLGQFFDTFTRGLTSAFDGALTPMFNDLNKSIAIYESAAGELASIIQMLGSIGSRYLPRLAQAFANMTVDFQDWLASALESGEVFDWIDHAIFELKELGRLFANIGRTLAGLGRIAERAGGSTLTNAADTFERIEEVVNGPTFQKNLTAVFGASGTAMSNIAKQSGDAFDSFMVRVAQTFTRIAPIAGNTIGTLLQGVFSALDTDEITLGLASFFTGLGGFVDGIVPSLDHVSDAIAALLDLVGRLAAAFGTPLGQALTIASDAITTLTGPVGDVAEVLAPALDDLLEAIGPVVDALAEGLGGLLTELVDSGALESLAESVVNLAEVLSPILVKLIETFFEAITDIAPGVVEDIAKAINGLADAIDWLDRALGSEGGGLKLGGLEGIIEGLGKVTELWKTFTDIDLGPGDFEFNPFASITNPLAGLADLPGNIGALVENVKSLFSGGWFETGTDAIGEFFSGIGDALGSAGDWVAEKFGVVTDAIGDFFSSDKFEGFGGNILKGIATGLLAGPGMLLGAFRGVFEPILKFASDTFSKIRDIAKDAWDGIQNLASKTPLGMLAGALGFGVGGGGGNTTEVSDPLGIKKALAGAPEAAAEAARKVQGELKAMPESIRIAGDQMVANAMSMIARFRTALDLMPQIALAVSRLVPIAIQSNAAAMQNSGVAIVRSAISGMASMTGGAASVGTQIVRGFAQGMANARGISDAAAKSVARSALASARGALGIQSPSREFMTVGAFAGEGFALGLSSTDSLISSVVSDSFGSLVDVGQTAMDGLIDGMESRFGALRNTLGSVGSMLTTTELNSATGGAAATALLANAPEGLSPAVFEQRVLNYYSASAESLSSEEELFGAAKRTRMVF